jgi:membrane-bound ClpP family serine protease
MSFMACQELDKLTQYLVVGGVLIVVGVGLLALSTTGLPSPIAGSFGILGAVALVLGLIMVIGAMFIDLSQLHRERLKLGQPAGSIP